MNWLLRKLYSNEIYWGLRVSWLGDILSGAGDRWAVNARHRLGKLSGKLPANTGGKHD